MYSEKKIDEVAFVIKMLVPQTLSVSGTGEYCVKRTRDGRYIIRHLRSLLNQK